IHLCDETTPGLCPGNGFRVLPEGGAGNWIDMQSVPMAPRELGDPPIGIWNVTHFATSATDAALLGMLTKRPELEPIATASLYWSLGLNPGVPSEQVVGAAADGSRWKASSFVYRGYGPFARMQDGFRTMHYSIKGWLDPWEDPTAFPNGDSPR